MNCLLLILLLLLTAFFASAEKTDDTNTLSANNPESVEFVPDNRSGDAQYQVAVQSDIKATPLELFMRNVNEQLRNIRLLLDTEWEIVHNHTTH
jgi:hypothetical protein